MEKLKNDNSQLLGRLSKVEEENRAYHNEKLKWLECKVDL